MTPIDNDGAHFEFDHGISEADAADAFFRLDNPDADDEPSGKGQEDRTEPKRKQTPVNEDEEPGDETDETADDSDESPEEDADDAGSEDGDEEGERVYADEKAYTKVKVGNEEFEVPVSKLARLFGQEAALTRKSQEVAEKRKILDTQAQALVAASQKLLERAIKRAEPFAKIDFLALAKDPNISAEEISYLRQQAQEAFEDVQFLQQELDNYTATIAKRQQEYLAAQAREAVKILADPKQGIPGWGEKLYDEIRAYAITAGLDKEIVNNLVDPAAIKLLHKAMLYDRGKSKVVTKKVNKTPKKVTKTTHNPQNTRITKSGDKQAVDRLKQTGRIDDAVNAFLARWSSDSD